MIRSDDPARLSRTGWESLWAYGVRTIVDLRDPMERDGSDPPFPLTVVQTPVADLRDAVFWRSHETADTPTLYLALLERWPAAFARAIVAVAWAGPGAVLVHCVDGRDRTGLVVAMLLALVGVTRDAIEADCARSEQRLNPLYTKSIATAGSAAERARLARENVARPETIRTILRRVDALRFVLRHGAVMNDVDRLQERLREH